MTVVNSETGDDVSKRITMAPSTKMGVNSIVVEHHMKYANKHNKKIDRDESINNLSRSIKKRRKQFKSLMV